MSKFLNVDELMMTCIDELPVKEIELEEGGTVLIQSLKGSDLTNIFSLESLDEKIAATLVKGLKQPILRGRQLQKFIDYSPKNTMDLFSAILELSNALGEVDKEQLELNEKK